MACTSYLKSTFYVMDKVKLLSPLKILPDSGGRGPADGHAGHAAACAGPGAGHPHTQQTLQELQRWQQHG